MSGKSVGVGFVLSAKTQKAEQDIHGFSKTVSGAMHDVANALSIAKNGLDLLGKGFNFIKDIVRDTITASLDYRRVNDGVVATFERFKDSIDVVKARIGDAFLPILLSLMEALNPIIKGMTDWLTANNKWLSQKIGETFLSMARIIGTVLLESVRLAGEAFLGWGALYHVLGEAFDNFVGDQLEGWSKILYASANAAEAAHLDALAVRLAKTGGELEAYGKMWHGAAREQGNAAQESVNDIAKWKESISTFGVAYFAALDRAGIALMRFKAIGVGGADSTADVLANALLAADALRDAKMNADFGEPAIKSLEELRVQGEAAGDVLAAVAARERLIAAEAAGATDSERVRLGNELQILQDRAKAARGDITQWHNEEKKQIQENIALYDKYGAAVGEVFGQIANGSLKGAAAAKAMAKVVIGAVRESAMKAIEAHAATSAAAAYESQAGIPIIGPFLGVAAAAAAFSFVEAYLSKFEKGGFVGGFGNRDSQMILAQPGEYIMSRPEVAAGGPKWAQGGGGNVSVALTIESLTPDSDAAFIRKAGRHIEKVVTEAIRAGRILAPAKAGT